MSATSATTFHDTLCARCHNEVRSPFSLVHALTDIHMATIHSMQTSPLKILRLNGYFTSPKFRKPRRSWRDHARTPRNHRWHHSDGGDAPQPHLPLLHHAGKQKVSIAFTSPTDGLPTFLLTSTTPIPALANTSLRHEVSKQQKCRGIRESMVGSNEEDKWPLPWVPLTFCVAYLPPSIFLCPHSFISP